MPKKLGRMRGVDDSIMNEVLDRYLGGRYTIEELHVRAVEAGAINEKEALLLFRHDIVRHFMKRRNRDLRIEDAFDQQSFAFTRVLPDGRRELYHTSWLTTTVRERIQLFGRERKKWTEQGRKCREIYDHALTDFGADAAREFKQGCLRFGLPPAATEDVLSGQGELF
jgi:hypothetical protein